MLWLRQFLRNNSMQAIIGTLVSLSALIGSLIAIDERYAHAADVEKDKAQTQQVIKDTTSELRRQMLEDKIFELDARKTVQSNLSPVDQALKDRYQRQLNEINNSK